MTRPVHRHAAPLPEYTDAELLARDRRAAPPVGILDGLLAKPRRDPPTQRWVLCGCGSKACPGSYLVTE